MRVLHIGKYYPPFYGGIETFMQDLMEASSHEHIISAALVHHHETSQPFSQEVINGIEVYRVPIVAKALFAPIAPRYGFYLEKVITLFRPDVIHLHLPNTASFYCLWNKKCRSLPWVVHWHSDVLGENSPWWLRTLYPVYHYLLERPTVNRSHVVIATSPPYSDTSPVLTSLPKQKKVIIPLGIRADKFKSSLSAVELSSRPSSPITLLMIGRLTFYKGHHLLLRALSELPTSFRKQFTLTIIGKGEEENALRSLTKSLGITECVEFLGGVAMDVLSEKLQSADLLCLPSIERTEAFGVVLMEAASVGVPSLVSNVSGSGMSWVVKHHKTGLVVDANKVSAITQSLTYIAEHRAELSLWGRNSLEEFSERFDICSVSASISTVYQQLIEE